MRKKINVDIIRQLFNEENKKNKRKFIFININHNENLKKIETWDSINEQIEKKLREN